MNETESIVDLRDSSVDQKWDKTIAPLLVNMEAKEFWVLDGREDLNNRLVEWADSLQAEHDFDHIRTYDNDLLLILAFIRVRKSLSLLQQLDVYVPGIPTELLYSADDKLTQTDGNPKIVKAARIYRDRILALYKAEIVTRIFSKERCEQLKEALTEASAA